MSFKIYILNLCFIILFVACQNKQPNIALEQNLAQKSNKSKTVFNTKAIEDTIFFDNMIVVKRGKEIDTLFKFNSNIDNKKFEVTVKNLNLNKELNFKKNKHRKTFITAIKEGVKREGVNFAGKFCFVYWGCGSPCQSSVVVDMESGIIYNGLPSSLGYKFKKNSRILIVNPPEAPTNYYFKNRGVVPYPEEYIWTGKRFIKN